MLQFAASQTYFSLQMSNIHQHCMHLCKLANAKQVFKKSTQNLYSFCLSYLNTKLNEHIFLGRPLKFASFVLDSRRNFYLLCIMIHLGRDMSSWKAN